MKIKRVLRFYFCSDNLEKALNDIILRRALSSCEKSGKEVCGSLLEVISDKDELAKLYSYIDGVIKRLPSRDVEELERYARLRTGIKRLPDGERRSIRRAAVKFVRHARYLCAYGRQIAVMNRYYCLMSVE